MSELFQNFTINPAEKYPTFATNFTDDALRVADAVNLQFRPAREDMKIPPAVAVSTAYLNPGGFVLLADELEQAPRVRLLLGAEPQQDAVRAMAAADADYDERVQQAVATHEAWLRAERDAMGFEREQSEAARRMVTWLQSRCADGSARVEVRRFNGGFLHGKAYIVDCDKQPVAIAGSSNFTYAGLAKNAELNLGTNPHSAAARKVRAWFDTMWQKSDPYDLAGMYAGLWDPHQPYPVFLRMLWELYQGHLEEERPAVRTFGGLTRFQSDGVARMNRLLDELGGVLVADEVGLGKTFLAAEVIHKATEERRQRVMVVAPASLKASMWEPFLREYGFRLTDVYSYGEVRSRLDPEHPDYARFVEQVADYALVVVDEAHNLRNSAAEQSKAVDVAILGGKYPKKVVLLTATPVNNSLADLDTLIRYFVRNDAQFAHIGIPSIRGYIRDAQAINPEDLTPERLFDLMDQIAVRRTRKFVREQYPNETITGPGGQLMTIRFPDPSVYRVDYPLDADTGVSTFRQAQGSAGSTVEVSGPMTALVDQMIYALDRPGDSTLWASRTEIPDSNRLLLARYTSSAYLLRDEPVLGYQVSNAGLLRSALLKRLESSPHALTETLRTVIKSHEAFLSGLNRGYVLTGIALRDWGASSETEDLDDVIAALDLRDQDSAQPVTLFDVNALRLHVESDLALLRRLLDAAGVVTRTPDAKVTALIGILERIARDARRPSAEGISSGDRRKVLVFSTYADTIVAIHAQVTAAIDAAPADSPLADYRGRIAPPTMGNYAKTQERGETGGVDMGGRASVVEHFAPVTAGRRNDAGEALDKDLFDLLLTTDVLSEGVNLQQAGQIINYDLPWNPMRIVQRHGRIDRIGSQFHQVHLGVFFPAARLDEILGLEVTLNRKLAQAEAAIGVGQVLPGREASKEVILTDKDVAKQIENLLVKRGASAALSGEEYRRRLFNAFEHDPALRRSVKDLPYGIGSGFEAPGAPGNAYVFCVRIAAEGADKPWFRLVPVDDDWRPIPVPSAGGGSPPPHPAAFAVDADTLTCLVAADPMQSDRPRWMTPEVYDRAYDAWAVARDHVAGGWEKLTDPNSLTPDVPKAFRDADAVVRRAGGFLGVDAQAELVARLRSVPSPRVTRAVRAALDEGRTDEERITLVLGVLDAEGVIAPPVPQPLPEINPSQIRLVAWMAVRGAGEARGDLR